MTQSSMRQSVNASLLACLHATPKQNRSEKQPMLDEGGKDLETRAKTSDLGGWHSATSRSYNDLSFHLCVCVCVCVCVCKSTNVRVKE